MPDEVRYIMSLNDLVTPKIQQADQAANKFESSLNSVNSSAVRMGAAIAGAFVVTGIGLFTKKVIDAGTTIEDATTGLTTLLKSQAEAADVIKNVQKDAQETPFEFKGLLAANKALISAGASAAEARTNVLNLANAVAATGGHDAELERMVVNLQQIRNTGQATALDIKQFAYAGINIYQLLADVTGKHVNQIKGMPVSYELLTKALAHAHAEGGQYANGLENMAKNTSVQISNLGDAVFNFAGVVFKDFKPAIDGAISGLNNFVSKGAEFYQWAKESLPGAVRTAHQVINELIFDFKALAVGVIAAGVAWGIAYPQTILYVGALVANGVATAGLTVATYAMTAAQWLLNAAMDANPIGIIAVSVGALVTGLILAYKHSEKFRAVLSGLAAVAKDIGGIFKGLGEQIWGALTFNPTLIKKGFEDMASSFYDVGSAFKRGYDNSIAESAHAELLQTNGYSMSSLQATKNKNDSAYKPKAATLVNGKTTSSSKVSGTKQVNIHITIGSLIKEFKLTTATLKEGTNKIQEQVTAVLLSAVNDSQITAGS